MKAVDKATRVSFKLFLGGFELHVLKRLLTNCCPVGTPDKRPGASKTSVSFLADQVGQLADIRKVRDELDSLGYDVEELDLLLSGGDEYEAEEVDLGEMDTLPAVIEAKAAQATFTKADLDELNLHDLFGVKQAQAIEALAEKLASVAAAGGNGGASQHFTIRLPRGELREVKGRAPKKFEEILDLAVASTSAKLIPIMLVGPAGCGKTTVARMVAESLNLDFSCLSFTEGTSESQLYGPLLPVGEAGKFEHVGSEFLRLYENGGVFLADEFDAADPNSTLIMNMAISNGYFPVPTRREKPIAKKHQDFVFIAACNTFGQGSDLLYAGRNQLDEATLDRFRAGTVVMDYDRELEQEICEPSVLAWGWPIRDRVRENNLRRVVSTRFLVDLSVMTKLRGWSQSQWEEKLFNGWSRDEISRVTYRG